MKTRITLTPTQENAVQITKNWFERMEKRKEAKEQLRKNPEQIFRLFGYAGTGKTTILYEILEELKKYKKREIVFLAYTGKAAMVMQQNDLPGQTIHSLIYKLKYTSPQAIREAQAKVVNATSDLERNRAAKYLKEILKPKFVRRELEEVEGISLLIIDECSMVGNEMLADLKAFDIPILAVGDPAQLPPIEKNKNETSELIGRRADVLLTEIHRQAADSPIIQLASKVRAGVPVPYEQVTGDLQILPSVKIDNSILSKYDILLTGKNATRFKLTKSLRSYNSITSPFPKMGEPVICLRNSSAPMIEHEDELAEMEAKELELISKPIYNGMVGYCVSEIESEKIENNLSFQMAVKFPEYPERVWVTAIADYFQIYTENKFRQAQFDYKLTKEMHHFDFGYVITVHKSQGSQWDKVAVIDDRFLNWDQTNRRRWLYTAVTRASQELLVVNL